MTDTHALVGHRLPGGSFRVEHYERVISHAAVGAPAIDVPWLHPVWVMLGALRGMGIDLGHVFALASASEDGVLFGEAELEQFEPLRAGVEYQVQGRVADMVRRQGRRAGPFDLLTLELEILDGESRVAVARQSFVIPRGADGAS